MTSDDTDVVVIGSGAGGLAAALPLAQAGLKVLVCEQHDVPGGWCHSFSLEGYRFSPGVHYIGGLESGGRMRAIYEGLGVSQDLAFSEINPDGYDHVLVGRQRFDIPKGRERLTERLIDRFPAEQKGIERYLASATAIAAELGRLAQLRGLDRALRLPLEAPTLLRWGLRPVQALIDHCVSDPFLKAILAAQSGDHGLPPSMVPAAVHCSIMNHYLEGAYYPIGGGMAIPRAFVRALKRAGGELCLSTSVDQILLEGKRAIGVRLAGGREIRARYVISNADPEVTLGRLVGREHLSRGLRRKLERVHYSVSALSLFMATDLDLAAAGMDSGNYWYYQHPDLDRIYRQGMSDYALRTDRQPSMFMTVTTLKDPTKMHSGHHTLEAFTFVSYDAFAAWAGKSGGGRPPAYLALKEKLAQAMLATADEIIPSLSGRLVFNDLGTPLTNAHYLNATQGNLYGIDKRRSQVGPWAFPARTEIEGLWMCGASTVSGHGVAGATSSGLQVARRLLGCRTEELLKAGGPELAIYPAEDGSQWPPRLRRRIERGRMAEPSRETEEITI